MNEWNKKNFALSVVAIVFLTFWIVYSIGERSCNGNDNARRVADLKNGMDSAGERLDDARDQIEGATEELNGAERSIDDARKSVDEIKKSTGEDKRIIDGIQQIIDRSKERDRKVKNIFADVDRRNQNAGESEKTN